ncbi:Rpn family recombination-promoting nuclease/putative transposase [Clostridium butyricum]|nr:hypothetical protein DRB99_08705 [Clostridium butyricum]
MRKGLLDPKVDFVFKNIFGSHLSKMYEEQLGEGEDYTKLCRTVCINILNFKYLNTNNFHTGYRFKEIESNEELTDVMEIHFIEIPKLDDNSNEKDMLVAWTEFLKNPESEKVRDLELSIKEIREAKDELIRMSNNDEERALYEMRANALRDKISALANAQEKGEKKKAIEIAKNMITKGLDIEMVIEFTGLTREEIDAINSNTNIME